MASFHVKSWNCRGIKARSPSTPPKLDFLETQFNSHPFDILVLLETHHKDMQDLPPLLHGFGLTHHFLHSPTQAPDTHCGVIVVIDKTLFDIIDSDLSIPGRLITATLRHRPTQVDYVFSFYYGLLPDRSTVPALRRAMTALTLPHTADGNSFFIGDFNFVDRAIDRPQGLTHPDRKTIPLWQTATAGLSLVDPYRSLHPNRQIFSYHMRGRPGGSRLDRVYVNESNSANVTHYSYVPTPFLDHDLQSFTFRTDLPYGPGSWKMNVSVLTDRMYVLGITTLIADMEALPTQDPLEWWDVFLLSVRSYTIYFTTTKRRISRHLLSSLTSQLEQLRAIPPDCITTLLQQRMDFLQLKLRDLLRHEADGYVVRARLPRFEDKEPDIQKYANMAKTRAKSSYIAVLRDAAGVD